MLTPEIIESFAARAYPTGKRSGGSRTEEQTVAVALDLAAGAVSKV